MSFSQSPGDSKAAPLQKEVNQPAKKLLVIDFDQTISSIHIHNLIGACMNLPENQSNRGNHEEEWKIAKGVAPIGDAARWKKIFETAKAQGYKVAVASFNSYPHIVTRYLKEIIGLKFDEQMDKDIYLRVQFPKDYSSESNKNSYIQQSMEYFLFMGSVLFPKDVTFIDDSKRNVEAAQEMGCSTILADNTGSHLKKLEAALGITLTSSLQSKSALFQQQAPAQSAASAANVNQGTSSKPPKPSAGSSGAAQD